MRKRTIRPKKRAKEALSEIIHICWPSSPVHCGSLLWTTVYHHHWGAFLLPKMQLVRAPVVTMAGTGRMDDVVDSTTSPWPYPGFP